ncbi:MAG: hypothetical protein IJT64_01790 [Kiritimatiellae bacterium]|nr:hypothetical protein [Kiritimatiellia bacterium]
MKATTHFSLFTFHFALMATVSSAMAVDAPFTYSGSYTVAAHPSLENTVVATFTSSGTISVTNRAKIVRVLVVGGGGSTSGKAISSSGGRGGRGVLVLRYHPAPGGTFILPR